MSLIKINIITDIERVPLVSEAQYINPDHIIRVRFRKYRETSEYAEIFLTHGAIMYTHWEDFKIIFGKNHLLT